MRQYIDTVQDSAGNALYNASIQVLNAQSGAAATIYSDNGVTVISPSIVTTDLTGQYKFFAPDGYYTLKFSYRGVLYKTLTPVAIFDGAVEALITDVGAANALSATQRPFPAAYAAGLRVRVKVANTNTGATTLNINSLGARPIVLNNGGALGGGELIADDIITLDYDGASWILDSPSLFPGFVRSADEIAASVTPSSFLYPVGDLRRYGAKGDGSTDDSAAFQRAVSTGFVVIPKGYSFKIVTPATKTGAIAIRGEGPLSKILCDSTVLTVTAGSDSIVDNFWMENITAPWIITRNPANWVLPAYATLQQSNTVLGYQPTNGDTDIWDATSFTANQTGGSSTMTVTAVSVGPLDVGMTMTGTGVTAGSYIVKQLTGSEGSTGTYQVSNTVGFASTTVTTLALTTPQRNQNVGPTLVFTGNAERIQVSRIFGRFVRIDMLDTRNSTVRDCNFRGGKGVWGSINFDNATNGLQTGQYNQALNNVIRYASNNPIIFQNNYYCLVEGNTVELSGESGIKCAGGDGRRCFYASVIGNIANQMYYDGIDLVTNFPVTDVQECYHKAVGNYCYGNAGDGINFDGRYNSCVGNTFVKNGRYGLYSGQSYSLVQGNYFHDNNQERNAAFSECAGGPGGNMIEGNKFWMGAGANSAAINITGIHYVANNYAIGGNFTFEAVRAEFLSNNIDDSTGFQTDQSFIFNLTNSGGTLQHRFLAQSGAVALGNYQSRVNSASSTLTNTPTATDSSTAMAAGGKIGSASTNVFWIDTAAQIAANALLSASIAINTTGTALAVRCQLISLNINGVTRVRPCLSFSNAATGAAFALTTANIGSGTEIQVQFYGKLT
jgi:hypothetical protein